MDNGNNARAYTHRAMDTEFRVSFGEGEDEALCASASAVAFARIDELERLLSRFDDTSDVAVIRALRPGQVATVAPETMSILVECVRVCAATGGTFDPTVGALMARLRHEQEGGKRNADWQMDKDTLSDLLARGGMQRLVLDVEHLRVAVKEDRLGRDTPLELDFGGIGKGFALDECRKILTGEQFELANFLLDAGTSTQWAQGAGWKLGVGGMWKDRTKIETALEFRLRIAGRACGGRAAARRGATVGTGVGVVRTVCRRGGRVVHGGACALFARTHGCRARIGRAHSRGAPPAADTRQAS